MEVKLIFRNFKKILNFNIENANHIRAFHHLKVLVKNFLTSASDEDFELYWKDKENDYIYFDTHDEFGLALGLNKDCIDIYVHDKRKVEFAEKCSSCKGNFNYILQCLHCTDLILCKSCFDIHNKNDVHFGVLEKSKNFLIHPFLYRELKSIIQSDVHENNIVNIGSYFQKLIGSYGVSFIDEITNEDEPLPFTFADNAEENFTLGNLNVENTNNKDQSQNRDIDEALLIMENMGFFNKDNWLKRKLTEYNGNINQTLDWINRQVNENKTN